jgi:predicted DNA-binding mobile mystery protein A
MKKLQLRSKARSRLDERFAEIGPSSRFTPPARGWIKAVREALGMTTAQLAVRMRVKQPSVVGLERSEAKGSIELATLRRAAAALDCTLIYALVPNKSLETTVRERAREFARQRLEPVEHSMLLEDQKVTERNAAARADQVVDRILDETNPRLFWD